MSYPFFSLSKSHRVAPIDFNAGEVAIRVEAVPDHGMATIWDADILIWAASQIVEARDAGLRTSRLMAATPYEILQFVSRGTSVRDYQRLKAALDRLQSTTVSTTIRQPAEGRRHRFSWINEWQERTDARGKPAGIEMIVPDWFYRAVADDALILTIDRSYFDLTGGLERWLYRLVRKHGGRQRDGWRFDFRHLHQKSGSLSPFKRFAFELRDIIRRQPLPGYTLFVEVEISGRTLLAFEPAPCGKAVNGLVPSGTQTIVPSGTAGSCYREPERALTSSNGAENQPTNLDSNQESNLEECARDGENPFDTAPPCLRPGDRRKRGCVMTVALLNQKGGVGKTTLALHLAGEWARRGQRVTLIDADPRGSALDWSQQREREGLPRLFGVIGLARDTLHREAPEPARSADRIDIDGPPRVAGLMRSALLAKARVCRPALGARFSLNRCVARTILARETAEALADHDPPVLASTIGQRIAFATAAQSGRLASEVDEDTPAAREIAALSDEIDRLGIERATL